MVEIELKSNELKEYVYLKLNKNRNIPLYDSDLDEIEYLSLNGLDFLDEPTDITLFDLVFFKNLKKCTIMNKEISANELNVLAKVEKLGSLQLTNCNLPSGGCVNINVDSLTIDRCKNVNMSCFIDSVSIKQLRVVNCENINLNSISKLKGITDLYLQNLVLDNIDEVKELNNLKYLNLNGTKIDKMIDLDKNRINIVHEDANYIYDN